MSDRTTIDKPEQGDKNLSVIVSHPTYMNLVKISSTMKNSFPGDRVSLGSVCRELLKVIDHKLFSRLHSIALQRNISVGALAKEVLEDFAAKQK